MELEFSIRSAKFHVRRLDDGGEACAWTPQDVERACRYELLNDESCDCTPFEHPAFSRGSDYSCVVAAQLVQQLCASGDHDSGVCGTPWEEARQAIISLRKERDALLAQLKATNEHTRQVQPE